MKKKTTRLYLIIYQANNKQAIAAIQTIGKQQKKAERGVFIIFYYDKKEASQKCRQKI